MYLFLSSKDKVLYVGKAKNLKARVSSYFTNATQLGEKTKILVSQIAKIKPVVVESELESLLLEAYYIKKYIPKYNIRLTDGKMYPSIGIRLKDDFPPVLYARKQNDPNTTYFGPYPQAGAMRLVLKTLRRAFPYVSDPSHPKRICLYNHIGLCPCPPIFHNKEDRLLYRHNIKQIIKVLEGKSKSVLKELEQKRDSLSKSENFEEARKTQKRIDALNVIVQPHIKPFEYDFNPNLRTDLRVKELDSLLHTLKQNGLDVNNLTRIECYDVSNTQGTNATASMVVFTLGEKDGAEYRRFKIKKDGKPNDFAMMEETIMRRIGHKEWKHPGLIIVDGGKGQITSALNALDKIEVSIPLIGLAKREETIIIPNSKSKTINSKQYQKLNFSEVLLAKDSPALQLLMRIRNEAHRFAITYHRKLRSKVSLDV